MKKQEQKRLSYFMYFKCHEVGHLANGCPNEKKAQVKERRREAKAC